MNMPGTAKIKLLLELVFCEISQLLYSDMEAKHSECCFTIQYNWNFIMPLFSVEDGFI